MTTTTQWLRTAAVAAVVLCTGVACGPTQVGSRYVKSQQVSASQGAVVTVSASDSTQLAGTKLEIPGDALAADTTITVEVGLEPLVATELVAGPVAVWGPAGTLFSKPARMTLPLQGLEPEDELSIFVREADGRVFEIPAENVVIDAAAGTVAFDIHGFTRFQPQRRHRCATDAQCRQGLACVNGRCRPSGVCQADADCPQGYVCVAAQTNTANCQAGAPCPGVCQPQPPQCQNCPPGAACVNGACTLTCGNVISCPPGSQCLNGACSASCTASNGQTGCPAGQVCDPSGRCVLPPPQCGGTSNTPNCPPGSQCINGACVALCNANTVCPQGLVCDLQRGLCVPPGPPTPQCTSNQDCPQGGLCLNGLCAFGCGANGMTCAPGEVCDPNRGVCVPGTPPPPQCSATQGCPMGTACINGVCVAACGNTSGGTACPPGAVCDPNRGVCVPAPTGCGANGATCNSGEVCVNGQCIAACGSAGTMGCPPGTQCDQASGACVPTSTQCNANGACAPGFACVNGQCVAACNATSGNGCPQGTQCDPATGQCVVTPVQCNANGACAAGYACVNGQCVAACSSSGANGCPTGSQCDPATGRCVPVQPTCGPGTAPCASGQVCLNGQCVAACSSGGTMGCPQGTACDAATGQCVPTPTACGSNGQTCAPGQQCLNGQCVTACLNITCPTGTQCDPATGACVQPPSTCGSNTACANGQVCLNGQCFTSCNQAMGCPSGTQCDAATGVCR